VSIEVQIITTSELLKKVRASTAKVSGTMRAYAEHVAQERGSTLTCMKGCAQCCYQKMMGTAGEGLAIYMYLREQDRWTPELKDKLVAYDRILTDHDHGTYFEKKIPCVFLDESTQGYGLCSVYDARPAQCAAVFSASGDPRKCAESKGEGQIIVLHEGVEMREHMLLVYALKDAVDPGPREPWDHLLMTLPGAVLWAAAAVEGLPPPKVLRLPISGGSALFDSYATHREGGSK
jgi:Fe-S-cluster containining protein